MVDWIADYDSRVESFPVSSQVKPGEIRAALPSNPPLTGESFNTLLKDVERVISARHHALAIAEFLCLLSRQHIRTGNSGRSSFIGAGRSRECFGRQVPHAPS